MAANGALTVTPAPLTITANNLTRLYDQVNPPLTASYGGFVNGDTSANLTTAPTLSTTATTSSAVGSYPITATGAVDPNYTISYVAGTLTVSVTANSSVYLTNATAAGALTLSGNAQLTLPGVVFVDSNSTSAISASGNAIVSASAIQTVGKIQSSGSAHLSATPVTGAAAFADPLLGLAAPTATGAINSVNLSGNSLQTMNHGFYSSITVSGNGKLTMTTGVYLIAGGGFSVSGNGSVSGSGVMIYNGASNLSTDSGTFGAVTLSGNGAISLTPMTTGAYANILIFQSRNNTKVLTLSGNGMVIPGGLIYAPAAAILSSGNGQFKGSIVASTMNISGNSIINEVVGASTTVYAPAQVRTAYGVNSLPLDGTGQTIAIVDAYDDPNVFQSLDAFDVQFGTTTGGPNLFQQYGPGSSFLSVINQEGQANALPPVDPNGPGGANWELEEALDVEWVHATAPGAKIILVEANSDSLADLMASAATAAAQPGVSVVSMSWGFPEGLSVDAADEALYNQDLSTPAGHQGVTFVASTGDNGTADEEFPAFSPNVVAVGGTSLYLNADGSYGSETGWGSGADGQGGAPFGSGGGVSQYQAEPTFQTAVQSTGFRTIPDVSLVADPNTGAWIADTYNLSADNPWAIVGGTSLSAPTWAGLIALSNQGRVANGLATLNSSSPTETQQALYNLPNSDFNDITSGSNGGFSAGVGYDLVTGLGTPVANQLVTDLAAYNGSVQSNRTVTVTSNDGVISGSNSGSFGSIDVFEGFAAELVSPSDLHSGVSRDSFPSTNSVAQAAPRFTPLFTTPLAGSLSAQTSTVQAAPESAHGFAPFAAVAFDVASGTPAAPSAALAIVMNPPVPTIQTGTVFVSATSHVNGLSRDGGDAVINDATGASAALGQIIEDDGAPGTSIDDPALLSILEGWDCSDDFGTRLSDILGAAGANGLQFDGTPDLAGHTVTDDQGGVALVGAAGFACFLAGRIDLVRNLRARDIVADIADMNCSSQDDEDKVWG